MSSHPLKRKLQGPTKPRKRRLGLHETLSPEAQRVIDLIVKQGTNVEMIGQAGTGKTYTLKKLAKKLDAMYVAYEMTASTGRAALNVGGKTIHSFSGAGIGDEDEHVYIKKVKESSWYKRAWNRPKVLIIEEISMLGRKYFELIDRIARVARKCDTPFGGLQVLVCGDYMQLPPVKDDYVFTSPVYKEMYRDHSNTVIFKDIKRQSCPILIKILQEMRVGKLSQESVNILQGCVDKPVPNDLPVKPMILFARRADVNGYNMGELNKLGNVETKVYNYTWIPSANLSHKENEQIRRNMERNVQAPTRLTLKIGAQVMLVRNMPRLLPPKFNGSMGVVTGFYKDTNHPVIKFADGTEMPIGPAEWKGPKRRGSYIQYPFILGWALTIHKAQGCTVDCARIDLGRNCTMPNQAYTALSRVRTIKGLYLDAFSEDSVRVHPDALAYHIEIGECQDPDAPSESQKPQKPQTRKLETSESSNKQATLE